MDGWKRPIIVVLTGGPGAGKTSVGEALVRAAPHRYALIREAATQIYSRLGTRWDRLDHDGRRDVQRRIYQLQLRQEADALAADAGEILLADRGTLDGATYWPDGPDNYWATMGTTLAAELARYDAVVWLQTCAVLGHYDGAASNPWRHESALSAIQRGERLSVIWRSHPRYHEVSAFDCLDEKIGAVRSIVERLLPDSGAS